MEFNEYLVLRAKAFKLVEQKSIGDIRFFSPIAGQPYWTHLMNVHNFLIIKGEGNKELLIASILHDIIEDSDVTAEYIACEFSVRISKIVQTVTKKTPFNTDQFYKSILEFEDDSCSKIKVADRIDNILTNYCYSEDIETTRVKLDETEKYFIPMAAKIGWRKDLDDVTRYCRRQLFL